MYVAYLQLTGRPIRQPGKVFAMITVLTAISSAIIMHAGKAVISPNQKINNSRGNDALHA